MSGRLAILLVLVLLGAGCGRPTGDFGRARPSVLHDRLLPAAGAVTAAWVRGEPVSGFNLTDTERELRDRAFAFVRPPHVDDWWLDQLVELERTRLLPAIDPAFDPTRYAAYLRATPTRSSEVRWSAVIAAMDGDALLVPPFCAVAAKVRTVDVERLATAWRQPGLEAAFVADAEARVAENDAVMAWVWRALAYRLSSYRHAIDRLEVETPSPRLFEANRAFVNLAGQRCQGAPAIRVLVTAAPRPSRLGAGPDPFDRPVLQK